MTTGVGLLNFLVVDLLVKVFTICSETTAHADDSIAGIPPDAAPGATIVEMDAASYLGRIGFTAPPDADLENLERLQRAHLTAVPFENLDVFHRRGVRTTEAWSVPKIVDRKRGGWCFELNGAFAWLLETLGYRVQRRAATVLHGGDSPMPTHLALEVMLDRPYLVDVGFGDSFIKPLPLDDDGPHDGGTGSYGFVFDGESTTLVSHEKGRIEPHYRFGPVEHTAADFDDASVYLQTTPGLAWTKGRFATRLIDGGPDRVTLVEDVIKFRRSGVWTEHAVTPDEWEDRLHEWFGLTS